MTLTPDSALIVLIVLIVLITLTPDSALLEDRIGREGATGILPPMGLVVPNSTFGRVLCAIPHLPGRVVLTKF